MYFNYGEKEINYLRKKDKKLGAAIDEIGMIKRQIDEDIFTAIIRAIIGQQVSSQARETVFNRLQSAAGRIAAGTIMEMTIDEIQAFGTTFKKAEYIKDFAQKVYKGELLLEELRLCTDEEVICKLCEIKGIGVWTAEMLLASALHRADVFSHGDIAIHRALRMLYRHKEITRDRFEKYRKRYSPCGTVASIYLWAIAAGAIEGLDDPGNNNKTALTKRKRVHR